LEPCLSSSVTAGVLFVLSYFCAKYTMMINSKIHFRHDLNCRYGHPSQY